MTVMLFSVLLYKLQSIIMYQCLPLPFLVLFSCTFPFLPVWPFYPQWRYPEGYCTPFQPVFSKCCYNEKCIDIFIISSMFTSSVWGGFSNSWCFSSTLKGVSFFGSSIGFLCTGFFYPTRLCVNFDVLYALSINVGPGAFNFGFEGRHACSENSGL